MVSAGVMATLGGQIDGNSHNSIIATAIRIINTW